MDETRGKGLVQRELAEFVQDLLPEGKQVDTTTLLLLNECGVEFIKLVSTCCSEIAEEKKKQRVSLPMAKTAFEKVELERYFREEKAETSTASASSARKRKKKMTDEEEKAYRNEQDRLLADAKQRAFQAGY